MIRITLFAAALATIAAVTPAAGQSSAPVRTLDAAATAERSPVSITVRKAAPCAESGCVSKPAKRAYVGTAPLGW
jgi:hypothetical protein